MRKLQELILYIAHRSEADVHFGAIKLNKILYYADFSAYRALGKPITEATYQHLPEGPAPIQLLPARKALLDAKAIEIEQRSSFKATQQRIKIRRLPDLSIFSVDEIEVVEQVMARLSAYNGRDVSELSHEEWGWKMTKDNEPIPYQTAWLSPEPLSVEQYEMGRQVAARHELLQ